MSTVVSKWMLLSKPETLQETGDTARQPEKVASQKKNVCTGPTRAPKVGQKSLVTA
jgi:hypothetical protein